jgi:23S rRNA-/tRNA-specific pseudouridylate synthase
LETKAAALVYMVVAWAHKAAQLAIVDRPYQSVPQRLQKQQTEIKSILPFSLIAPIGKVALIALQLHTHRMIQIRFFSITHVKPKKQEP